MFDDNSGDSATDETANSNDGQLGSAPGADTNDPSWTGRQGSKFGASALSFDAIDNYVEEF